MHDTLARSAVHLSAEVNGSGISKKCTTLSDVCDKADALFRFS